MQPLNYTQGLSLSTPVSPSSSLAFEEMLQPVKASPKPTDKDFYRSLFADLSATPSLQSPPVLLGAPLSRAEPLSNSPSPVVGTPIPTFSPFSNSFGPTLTPLTPTPTPSIPTGGTIAPLTLQSDYFSAFPQATPPVNVTTPSYQETPPMSNQLAGSGPEQDEATMMRLFQRLLQSERYPEAASCRFHVQMLRDITRLTPLLQAAKQSQSFVEALGYRESLEKAQSQLASPSTITQWIGEVPAGHLTFAQMERTIEGLGGDRKSVV